MLTQNQQIQLLQVIQRGVQTIVGNKFAQIICEGERDIALRAEVINTIGKALGEILDTVEYPIHWQRFIKRKDCPNYMKQTKTISIRAYYPKLSLPEEEHWVTIDK